jgi:dienelactone hydrolase
VKAVTNPKKLAKQVRRRGPHRVLKGDLGVAGLPGVLYTPETGVNLPAVTFAHDWLTPARRYSRTLEHLASWGFVVAAPDTEKGLLPSDGRLALDLATALQIISEVRLGVGEITVNRAKRAVVGHGSGVGAALRAAAADRYIHGVGALFPAPTSQQADGAAAEVVAPLLLLAAAGDEQSLSSNAGALSLHYGTAAALRSGGSATLRLIPGATAGGFAEGMSVRGALGAGRSNRKLQQTVRGALTGFLLGTVGDDPAYASYAEPDGVVDGTVVWDPNAEPPEPGLISKLRSIAG